MPSASIVIVNYNGAAFIEPTVRSALSQTPACEVIVVDNASTDDSLELLRRIPGLRLIANDRNGGFGAGANVGAAEARGEFVAFLNSDAIADAEWIATLTRWMPVARVDFASSVVASIGDIWFAGGRWYPWLCAALTAKRPQTTACDWVSGCALIVRRSAFESLGGFDEAFFLYFEDVDLCLRARAAGYRIAVHPQPLVRHDVAGRSGTGLGFEKMLIASRAKGRLAARHVPPYMLPLAVPFQFVVSPAGQRVALRRFPDVWRAFLGGFTSIR